MKTLTFWLILSCLLFSHFAFAQVDDIKSASSSHSSSRSGSSDYGSDDDTDIDFAFAFVDFFFTEFLGGMASWQELKLEKKKVNPRVISFDVMLQSAVQPSSYYILNPRVRANWGLFSTDFRFTYLVEESIEGYNHLRTDDWQILQLNLVTTRNVIGRVGGGILHENFSGGKTFSEWTVGIHLQSDRQHIGGMAEYRWSEPRDEWNAQVQFRLFQSRAFNGYFTTGIVHQRYYDTVTAWGLQGGFMLSIF